jgi:hypothetical protein
MMRRLRDALPRGRSTEQPQRQYRPNELRLDVVRAERLRRKARQADLTADSSWPSLEELEERRPQESVPAPAAGSHRASRQIAALRTRSGLHQAWLLKETLSPPLALRDPFNDDHR